MDTILIALGISELIAFSALIYYLTKNLSLTDQNKLICCVVKKYAPDKYGELAKNHPEIVKDCSESDNCNDILGKAGL